MAFEINITGEKSYTVNDRMDAMYHLGALYGGRVYNKAVKQGLIIFNENSVTVKPFNIKELERDSYGIATDYILEPKD